ncbi:MAG: hypothetical protein J6P16_01825 [Eubacterium sp.]|nr:hypothetical protein [Eubacterium sp.]
MNWLRRMMYGRYARMDQLNIALFVLYLAITLIRTILGLIFRAGNAFFLFGAGRIAMGIVFSVLFGLQMGAVVCFILRIFSKNIAARQAENLKFVGWLYSVRDYGNFRKKKKQARNEGKELFKCPTCKKVIRVPLGHGRIEITCPNCGRKFVKKT